MYYIKKKIEVSGAHRLVLDYKSRCERLHGHNWQIVIYCKSETLDCCGMIIDFSEIEQTIMSKLDHQNLNEVLDFNPTAENIAKWICDQVPHCYRVDVQEDLCNEATYEANA